MGSITLPATKGKIRIPEENNFNVCGTGHQDFSHADIKKLASQGIEISNGKEFVEGGQVSAAESWKEFDFRLCFYAPYERNIFLKRLHDSQMKATERCGRRRLNACDTPHLHRLLAQVRDLNHRDHP